jgi:hypothetical protein
MIFALILRNATLYKRRLFALTIQGLNSCLYIDSSQLGVLFTCSSCMGLRNVKMYYYFRDSYGFVTYVHPDSAAYAVESTYYNVLLVDANIIVLDKNCDFHDYPFCESVSPSEITI